MSYIGGDCTPPEDYHSYYDSLALLSNGAAQVMDFKTVERLTVPLPPKKKEPPRGQLTTWSAVRDYVFAGKAVFTLCNPKTGVRLTYKVTAKRGDLAEAEMTRRRVGTADAVPDDFVAYFVNLLRGPDNTKDFAYMGVLRKPGNFFITSKSQVTRHPTSYKALVYFLDRMRSERDVLSGKPLEFWHNGHCGCCGRMLTVPKSVADGIGPECAKRVACENVDGRTYHDVP